MKQLRSLCGAVIRLCVAAALLWLVWGVWRPVYFTIPADVAHPQTLADAALLEPETVFLIEGRVEPQQALSPQREDTATPAAEALPTTADGAYPMLNGALTEAADGAHSVSNGILPTAPNGTHPMLNGAQSVAQGELLPPLWQGRFIYTHRMYMDVSRGIGGKTMQVVTLAQARPAVRFIVAEEAWLLPSGSYSIENAPAIPRRFWPRKWLLTTPVDDWDRTSRGFFAGQAALAYGRVDAGGQPVVEQLMVAPVSAAGEAIGNRNRGRWWLILGAKIALSLFALSLLRRNKRPDPQGIAA